MIEHDDFANLRLPDLPNDGYATRREKAMTDEIMFFIRATERDRVLLLSIVCGGKDKFRSIARKAWRHLKVTTTTADAVFGYLELLGGRYPHLQLEQLLRMPTPFERMMAAHQNRH